MERKNSPIRSIVELLEARRLLAVTPPPGFVEQVYVQQPELLDDLTAMEFAPDGRLFVLEKKGNVRIIKGQSVNLVPFLSLDVKADSERGLDGITLDPNFASNGYIYLYYTAPHEVNRLVRVTADPANPDAALPGSIVVLLDNIASDTGLHNGGSLHFGNDGMLYLGTGDSGTAAYASDLSSLNGKILRLNVGAYPASIIPADNPFVNTAGARPEVWAYGLRNPFTSAVDPQSGRLFVNDVGGSKFEEINEIVKGGGYGWPDAEGASTTPSHVNPIYQYAHQGLSDSTDSAITGGVFYDGDMFPAEYKGKYFFADYARKFIRVLDPETYEATTFIDPLFKNVIDLDVGPDGALYGLGFLWRIMRYSYEPPAIDLPVNLVASTLTGTAPLTVDFSAVTPSTVDTSKLTYLWDFHDDPTDPVPGVSGGANFTHTYRSAGTYRALVTVFGGRAPVAVAVNVVVDGVPNRLPRIRIQAPKTYTAGQTVRFSSIVKDPEDGAVPLTGYNWRIDFHHAEHTHPFISNMARVGGGSFEVPTRLGENDPDQWYRIHLAVTDSSGQTATTFLDVRPKLGTLWLKASENGLTLSLDGTPVVTPSKIVGVQGAERTVAAAPIQTLGSTEYLFEQWSDGKEATRTILTPNGRSSLFASYRAVSPRDLELARISIPPGWPRQGKAEPRAVAVTLANVGPADITAEGDLRLYLSVDAVLDDEDLLLTTLAATPINLRAGRRMTVKLPAPLNPVSAIGSHHFFVRIENLSVQDENPLNDLRSLSRVLKR